METLFLYLNGDRGLKVLEALSKLNIYNIFVFKNISISSEKVVSKLKEFKNNKSIHFKTVKNINSKEHLLYVKKINPDISIVAGFSQIFNDEIINAPKFGTINLHAGPLPKYRGGSPLNWQIINGEKIIGLSIIQMNKGIDTGEVLCQSSFELKISESILDVHQKTNLFFSQMVLDVLNKIKNKSIIFLKQDESKATYWHQRSDLDGKISWKNMTALQAHNFIRALSKPYNGSYTFYLNHKLRIFSSKLTTKFFHGSPGRVVKIKDEKLLVICADKGLYIEEYKFEDYSGDLINGMHLI